MTPSFWSQVWPDEGLRCIVGIKDKSVKQSFLDPGTDPASHIADANSEGRDLYFSPATYAGEKRAQTNVAAVRSFWVDIDCGEDKPYPDWQAGLKALMEWVRQQSFHPPSAIVHSGYGLHVYWSLSAPVTRDVWEATAQRFKAVLRATGLHVDQTRTADCASILRVPGSYNFKRDPVEVRVLASTDKTISHEDFQRALPLVGPRDPDRGPKPTSEFAVEAEYPPADLTPIVNKCAQMRHVHAEQGAVAEPLWRAALSIVWRSKNGEDLIHDWSKGDPRYDSEETRAKAERTGGPATCEYMESCNPGGCKGCPFAGKISSPILLGTPAPEAEPQPDETPAPTRVNEVGDYRVTSQGVKLAERDENGAVVDWQGVTLCPLWVVELRERARTDDNQPDRSTLIIQWHSLDGANKRALLAQSDVYDPRSFTRWLSDNNLMGQVLDPKLLAGFIRMYTRELLKQKATRKYHDALGWFEDGFVLGPRIITAKTTTEALIQSTNPIAKIAPRGSAESWTELTSCLKTPGYWPQAFTVLASFGSPLLEPAGVTSAVVSLVGRSGVGKTLSARTGLSVWGDPSLLMQAASATTNAIERQMGGNRHVPHLLDEATHMTLTRLNDYVYMAANGQGKDTLNRNREHRERSLWALVPFLTSNNPLLEHHAKDMQEAHRRRIIELALTDELERRDALGLVAAGRDHHGTVAEPYLRVLCQHRKALPKLFEQSQEHLMRHFDLPDANRFGIWTIAAALAGGLLAYQAGLIAFDPRPVIDRAADSLAQQAKATDTDEERILEALSEFMVFHKDEVCVWPTRKEALALNDPRTVTARYCPDYKILYLASTRFHEYLRQNALSVGNLHRWMRHNGITSQTCRLAPQTTPVGAIKIPMGELGLDPDDAELAVKS